MAKDTDIVKWRILIVSGQSDGDASARPTAQQQRAGGLIPISHNMALDVLWRQRLGSLFMEKASPEEHAKHPNWVLEALPANYQLYAIPKPATEPMNAKKLATTGRFFGLKAKNANAGFQSPEEFLPHLVWIVGDRSKACECTYCKPPPAPPPQEPTSAQLSLSAYTSLMQKDILPTSGLYRPGEMVWANPNDTYPVICVIANRKMIGQELIYELIPLKSPRVANRSALLLSQNRLRPWLSYTPPDPLQPSISGRKYQVQWDEINWQEWTHQDAELHDASIIASIRIACNIGIIAATKETGEGIIPCLWLGAEKIWRNGEVRVMTPEFEGQKGMDVLVIKNITRDTKNLYLQGNIYSKVLQYQPPTNQGFPDPPPTPRMLADAAAMNCSWHLKYQNVQINATEIKGRWYPTSVLRPIINPAAEPPDNSFYDVSGLLNNNTDIPSQSGGWKISMGDRGEHILGVGHLPGNQPAGWINVDDWKRLYTDDSQQLNELTASPPAPEAPTKTAKKGATTRKAPAKRVSMKKQAATAAAASAPPAQPEVEPQPEPQQQPPAAEPAIAENPPLAKPPAGELYDDDQGDNHDEFLLRQIEQDGADFEKLAQENDPWGFFG
ncbi:hypothetical protein DRE_02231 [Drechslerella stenobrocha 248]|uniref:Cryptic loci regulator 2 N-terminal domain-containing protein n=1 Tax=Drechslerella stenobrocha 248 TaxID=1043628 RepID=W7I8U4_9PEZI|nr:hypothetical protein DRE_02231 [Drechslerella stenobrocha 248]